MILLKHTPGKPLTAPELRERRAAARARWSHRDTATVAAGAGIGAAAGAVVGGARRAIFSANRAAAAARLAGINLAEEITGNDARIVARARARREAIVGAVQHRMRANPQTKSERQQRLRTLLDNPRRLTPRPTLAPVIGTTANLRIYDYEIAGLGRQLLREKRHLTRLTTQAGDDIDRPDLRRQRVRVQNLQDDIDKLERLKAAGPRQTARAAATQSRRGQRVEMPATTERKFRGGETQAQIGRRISTARRQLKTRLAHLLDLLDRRTSSIRTASRQSILNDATATVRDAFNRGTYGRQIARSGGRGALLGAGIGLSIAGLGILAHHVAIAGEPSSNRVEKRDTRAHAREEHLAKAASDTPEGQMGLGLAMTYRRWIDRLLGRTPQPMHLGDDVAEAMSPGLTQAYTEGLTNPPIVGPAEPGYHINVDFDALNPSVRRHMAEYALDRIVDITQRQRDAIRDALMTQSVLQGIGPNEVARTIRESIGLTPYQRGVVEGYRRMLMALDPRALERELRDRRYDRTIAAAIRTGTPLSAEQIDKMVDAYHRRMLALRSRTIARTEALRATSYGGVARAQEVLDQHPELDVTKRWLATADERTRCTHRDLDGREVDGMTTPFITLDGNPIRWPLDDQAVAKEVINCRCTLQFIFKPRAGQLRRVAA